MIADIEKRLDVIMNLPSSKIREHLRDALMQGDALRGQLAEAERQSTVMSKDYQDMVSQRDEAIAKANRLETENQLIEDARRPLIQKNKELNAQLASGKTVLRHLKTVLNKLRRMLFGPRSMKMNFQNLFGGTAEEYDDLSMELTGAVEEAARALEGPQKPDPKSANPSREDDDKSDDTHGQPSEGHGNDSTSRKGTPENGTEACTQNGTQADDGEQPAEEGGNAGTSGSASTTASSGRKTRRKNTPRPRFKKEELLSNLPRLYTTSGSKEELDSLLGKGNYRIIGYEETEKVVVIPARCYCLVTLNPKCRILHKFPENETEELLEKDTLVFRKPEFMPRTIATPSLVASIVYDKYCTRKPLYMQQGEMNSRGFPLSRMTMSNWLANAAKRLKVVVDAQFGLLLQARFLHCDETKVQVILDNDKTGRNGFVFLLRTGELLKSGPGKFDFHPVIRFIYSSKRNDGVLKEYLADYEGYLTADGYIIYVNFMKERNGKVIIAPCLQHIRAYFKEAYDEIAGDCKDKEQLKESIAYRILYEIAQIYKIERPLKELSAEERLAERRARMTGHFDNIRRIIDSVDCNDPEIPETLRVAVGYLRGQWDKLQWILKEGNVPLDDNAAERLAKIIAAGRDNWEFFFSKSGAEDGMIFFSLVETAKANGADPFYYIEFLLEKLPEDLEACKSLSAAELASLNPWSPEYRQYELEKKQADMTFSFQNDPELEVLGISVHKKKLLDRKYEYARRDARKGENGAARQMNTSEKNTGGGPATSCAANVNTPAPPGRGAGTNPWSLPDMPPGIVMTEKEAEDIILRLFGTRPTNPVKDMEDGSEPKGP